jgi:hypothetical protein
MSFASGQTDKQPIDALSRAMRRKPTSSWVQSMWGGCAFCVGSAAGHIGCLIAPLLSLGANGATAASGHDPMLMIGSALAINSVTLGVWYRVRGRFVSKPIKLATIGFAVAGMAITTGINLKDHAHIHNREQAEAWFKAQSPDAQENVREIAKAFHMSVDDYLTTFEICSPTKPSNQKIKNANYSSQPD